MWGGGEHIWVFLKTGVERIWRASLSEEVEKDREMRKGRRGMLEAGAVSAEKARLLAHVGLLLGKQLLYISNFISWVWLSRFCWHGSVALTLRWRCRVFIIFLQNKIKIVHRNKTRNKPKETKTNTRSTQEKLICPKIWQKGDGACGLVTINCCTNKGLHSHAWFCIYSTLFSLSASRLVGHFLAFFLPIKF